MFKTETIDIKEARTTLQELMLKTTGTKEVAALKLAVVLCDFVEDWKEKQEDDLK